MLNVNVSLRNLVRRSKQRSNQNDKSKNQKHWKKLNYSRRVSLNIWHWNVFNDLYLERKNEDLTTNDDFDIALENVSKKPKTDKSKAKITKGSKGPRGPKSSKGPKGPKKGGKKTRR